MAENLKAAPVRCQVMPHMRLASRQLVPNSKARAIALRRLSYDAVRRGHTLTHDFAAERHTVPWTGVAADCAVKLSGMHFNRNKSEARRLSQHPVQLRSEPRCRLCHLKHLFNEA